VILDIKTLPLPLPWAQFPTSLFSFSSLLIKQEWETVTRNHCLGLDHPTLVSYIVLADKKRMPWGHPNSPSGSSLNLSCLWEWKSSGDSYTSPVFRDGLGGIPQGHIFFFFMSILALFLALDFFTSYKIAFSYLFPAS
jgi:hypothetical protein